MGRSKTTIGAQCTVKNKCFFGVASTVPSNSTIDTKTLVTSGITTPTKTYPGCVVGQKGILTLTSDSGASSMVESNEFIRFI